MKKVLFLFLFPIYLCAQDASLQYSVSSDTILFGNKIILKVTAENTELGQRVPQFEDFQIIGQPSSSFQTSIINGAMTKSQSYTYYLSPLREGLLVIEPMSIIDDEGNLVHADPLYIQVLPNPEGIIEEPKLEQKENGFFFNFGDPFNNEHFDVNPPIKKKVKKRRPTYKI